MPDNSAILALPYIQPSQAQKHVTHNAALGRLDVLVQLSVIDFGATTPPVTPTAGETHALGTGPSGDWAGQDDMLATWADGIWQFIAPQSGWRAWGQTPGELRIWDGTEWVLPVNKVNNLDGLGIRTTYDATNRLSVKSDATLLSHDGDDHQLKINKAGSSDTASLLFQSDWTGQAEMGLSGDTDFSIKVSDDGSTWTEALKFDGSNGFATGAAIQSSTTSATAAKITVNGMAADFSFLSVSDGVIELNGNLTGGEQQTIADDAVGSFTPPRKGGFAVITTISGASGGYPDSSRSGLIFYDVGVSLGISKSMGWSSSVGSWFDLVTTDVAGTTGTDGNITIAAQTGVLKIENRAGSSRSFYVTWL